MNPLPGDLFARRLRQERERLSISQAELARRIAKILGTNVDPSAVTRIEQQVRAVRLDEAVAAAQALGVPLTVLVAEDPDGESEAQLQQLLADLAVAQRQWERDRQEVLRITKAIQMIGGSALLTEVMDPRLLESIDDRVPLSEGPYQDAGRAEGGGPGATAPGA